MKVSGFSIVRNAIKYGYPARESLQSLLPLCDELVVAVGNSDDGTRQMIEDLREPKIRIVDTIWDESLKSGGRVLAAETDKAFKAIAPDSDWCIYIQADEVMHEADYPAIRKAMLDHLSNTRVDGLLFKYMHFWGSYDYTGASSRWYRNEIRIVRNNRNIYSYRDAQGFRKNDNEKLNVKPINACIYHYGWVREPKTMHEKVKDVSKFWNGDSDTQEQKVYTHVDFDYDEVDLLQKFAGTHPAIMQQRIDAMNWKFEYDLSRNKQTLKDKFKNIMEKLTGNRPFDYKNYRIV